MRTRQPRRAARIQKPQRPAVVLKLHERLAITLLIIGRSVPGHERVTGHLALATAPRLALPALYDRITNGINSDHSSMPILQVFGQIFDDF